MTTRSRIDFGFVFVAALTVYALAAFRLLPSASSKPSDVNEPKKTKIICRDPGGVQILTGKDELWVFIETCWYQIYSRKPRYGSTGPGMCMGYDTVVASKSSTGWRRTVITGIGEKSYYAHPNLYHMVALHDRIYSWRVTQPELGFAWNGREFVLLEEKAIKRIHDTVGMKLGVKYFDYLDLLDNAMARTAQSWHPIRLHGPFSDIEILDNGLHTEKFKWNSRECTLYLKKSPTSATIGVTEPGPKGPTSHDIVSFDYRDTPVTEAEFKRLFPYQ